jgi:fructose-1,6-bisphosphatase II / sedoheptulose-1,7-bisphosphatase
MGIQDLDRIYSMEELARGDVMFAATGVTDGTMLKGVRRTGHHKVHTESIVMRAKTGTVRIIETEHNLPMKASVVPHFSR